MASRKKGIQLRFKEECPDWERIPCAKMQMSDDGVQVTESRQVTKSTECCWKVELHVERRELRLKCKQGPD